MVEARPQPTLGDVDLSVVIPAYNEAARIERTLEQVIAYLNSRAIDWEIVVVDDGSTDATALVVARVASSHRSLKLVRLTRNSGKGAAQRAGVAATAGARILCMDADLATPIEELQKLEEAIRRGAKIAVGSRAHTSAHVARAQSWLRVLLGRAGNLWIRLVAVPGIHDTQCGFKLFDGDLARELFARATEDRFGTDIEILCAAHALDVTVEEVGVRWNHQDGSKVRWHDYLDVFLKVPRIARSVRWRRRSR